MYLDITHFDGKVPGHIPAFMSGLKIEYFSLFLSLSRLKKKRKTVFQEKINS